MDFVRVQGHIEPLIADSLFFKELIPTRYKLLFIVLSPANSLIFAVFMKVFFIASSTQSCYLVMLNFNPVAVDRVKFQNFKVR